MKTWMTFKRIIKTEGRHPVKLLFWMLVPLAILGALYYYMNAAQTPVVTIGTFQVEPGIVSALNQNKAVVHEYSDNQDISQKIKANGLDAFITKNGRDITIVYKNQDPGVTKSTRSLIKVAISQYWSASMEANVQNAGQYQYQAMENGETQYANGVLSPDTMASANFNYIENFVVGNGETNLYTVAVPALMSMVIFAGALLLAGFGFYKDKRQGMLQHGLYNGGTGPLTFGYGLGYGLLGIIQAVIVVLMGTLAFGHHLSPAQIPVLIMAILLALSAVSLGILIAAAARKTSFLAGMSALIIAIQIYFSGIVSISGMNEGCRMLANLVPVHFAATAIQNVLTQGFTTAQVVGYGGILVAFTVVFGGLGFIVISKQGTSVLD
ncbi:MAG: ABC transporter permease [Eubacteriaceae bacterium]|nr:ABC transporter permease [Eubacteriaceae bacterium]